jgi:small-conductance mechanosensitive channel
MIPIEKYFEETIATVILIILIVGLRLLAAKVVKRYARMSEILEHRTNLVIKYIHILLTLLGLAALFIIWGVKTDNIFTTLSAVITVVGVALFAQWSIISNVTAGVILLFSFPFKIGDTIRIHDKDFPIEAEIEDIRAFYTLLKTADGELLSYPNNLLLQKGVSIIHDRFEHKEFTD